MAWRHSIVVALSSLARLAEYLVFKLIAAVVKSVAADRLQRHSPCSILGLADGYLGCVWQSISLSV